MKENEINDRRIEFESPICISDFFSLSRLIKDDAAAAVKFYNDEHLSAICVEIQWIDTYLLGLLCFRRLLLLFIGKTGGVCWSVIVFVDSIISSSENFKSYCGSIYRAVIVKFSFRWNFLKRNFYFSRISYDWIWNEKKKKKVEYQLKVCLLISFLFHRQRGKEKSILSSSRFFSPTLSLTLSLSLFFLSSIDDRHIKDRIQLEDDRNG